MISKTLIGIAFVAASTITASVGARADSTNVQQLINANGCHTCHAAQVKIIGPAWGWIAYHFKDQKDAVETVADFIINGGVGYWKPWTGEIPMPSHPNLTKDQARAIAQWILSQPPIKPPQT